MKKLFTCLVVCLPLLMLQAQTPFQMISSHDNGNETSGLSVSSMHNPWVGAKLGYNVSGDVSQSFLLSARAMYVIASGDRFAFPVVGNVGLNNPDSLGADSGVSFGLFPWYNLSGSGNLAILLHGGLNYQILDKSDANAGNQFRILAGLEAVFYPGDGTGAPVTLSVAPEFITNTGLVDNSTFNLNFTGVLPIANGLGLLLEGAVPMEKGTRSTGLSIGVIVNSPIR